MSTMSLFKGLTGKAISEVAEPSPSAKLNEGLAMRLPSGVDPQDALAQASSFGAPAAAAGIMGAGAYLKNEIGSRVIDKGIGLATSAAGKVASMFRAPRGDGRSPFDGVINKELRLRQKEQQPQTEASLVPNGASPSPVDPSGEAHGVGKRTEAANPAPPPTMKVSPSSVLKGIAKSASASTKSLQAATAQTTATVAGALQPKTAPAAAPAKREQADEGRKLVHTASKGGRTAKVYRDSEHQEYQVKHFTDGKHHEKADYYTTDKEDAHATAQHWLKNESEGDKCAGCGEAYPCSDSKRTDISGRERAKHYVLTPKKKDEDVWMTRDGAEAHPVSPGLSGGELPQQRGTLHPMTRDSKGNLTIGSPDRPLSKMPSNLTRKGLSEPKSAAPILHAKDTADQAIMRRQKAANTFYAKPSGADNAPHDHPKTERLADPFAEAERLVQERMNGDVDEVSRRDFASPGSALRRAHKHNPRNLPCPTCKEPDKLTPKDKRLGYQCDDCARREEGPY